MRSTALHTVGPLACVAATLGVGLFDDDLAWLPGALFVLLVLSLAGTMWSAVAGRAWGGLAALALLLPGVGALGAPFVLGRWPSAARARGIADEGALSSALFHAVALAWGAVSASAAVALLTPSSGAHLALAVSAVAFAALWAPAAREVVAILARAPRAEDDEAAREWLRERQAVLASLLAGGGADRAWALDVVRRHAQRGEPEAQRVAEALMSQDVDALRAAFDLGA